MLLRCLILLLFSLSHTSGDVTANDDWVNVAGETPICISVLDNDIWEGGTPSLWVTNSTNGFAFLNHPPFFMVTHDFEAVFEVENYQLLNYRSQQSYSTYFNPTYWQVVTNMEYPNLIDKGLRCWPNVQRSAGEGNLITGPAIRYDIAFRQSNLNYRAYVKGCTCNGSTNTTVTNSCKTPLDDDSVALLFGPQASFPVANVITGFPAGNVSCDWREFPLGFPVYPNQTTWPPMIVPIWLAVHDDGVVIDRVFVSFRSNLANSLPANLSNTQFVNCSATQILYFPQLGFSGTDYLTYSISDGTTSSVGLVTISVDSLPTPTATPSTTPSPSPSPSVTPSHSPSPSITPSHSPPPSITPSHSPSRSISISPSASLSCTPSNSPSRSISPSSTPSRTPSLTHSPLPSSTPSVTPSIIPSISSTPSSVYSSVTPSLTTTPSVTRSTTLGNTISPSPTTPLSSVSASPEPMTSPSTSSSPSKDEEGNRSNKNTAGIVAGVVIGASVSLVLAGCFVYKRRRHNDNSSLPPKEDTELNEVAVVLKKEEEKSTQKVARFEYLDDIEIKEVIGSGCFGEVFRGVWQGTQEVALKKLKVDDKMEEFLQEASMLQKCSFDHVVRFIGLHRDENNDVYMVTEFMSGGALNNLLQKQGEKLSEKTFIEMARDAAVGIRNMANVGLVHRDLAARNLLVHEQDGKFTVKVADFGLARHLAGNYYTSTKSVFPIKWSAPEVLKFEKFSAKSDVWSFGVVLWEIFECGSLPYRGMDNNEATEAVLTGFRLPQPSRCPDSVYQLMRKCWAEDPAARPTFDEICTYLQNLCQFHSSSTVIENNFYANRN